MGIQRAERTYAVVVCAAASTGGMRQRASRAIHQLDGRQRPLRIVVPYRASIDAERDELRELHRRWRCGDDEFDACGRRQPEVLHRDRVTGLGAVLRI